MVPVVQQAFCPGLHPGVGTVTKNNAVVMHPIPQGLGITPQLHIPSQIVLIALMYLGRVGGLTLIYAAVSSKKPGSAKLPQESITIG